jgi:hypothetical protein
LEKASWTQTRKASVRTDRLRILPKSSEICTFVSRKNALLLEYGPYMSTPQMISIKNWVAKFVVFAGFGLEHLELQSETGS